MKSAGETAKEIIELIIDELKGHDEVGQRVLRNTLLRFLAPADEVANPTEPGLEPFSDAEAKRYGRTMMEFGQHYGQPVDNVELQYLRWLCDRSRETFRNLHRYLNSALVKRESDD